jgi:pimeloyl-ACP methyl ester carboxylesterase
MTPAAPSDPPIRTLAVRGQTVAYRDAGVGPLVLALHGLPGSGRDFRWLGAALEPRARLLRLDLPGFGDTPRAAAPDPGQAAQADWVRAVLDALGIEACVVLGHSFGGPLATRVAATDPRVRGLALLASVGTRVHRGLGNELWPRAARLACRLPGVEARVVTKMHRAMVKAGFPTSMPRAEVSRTLERLASTRIAHHRRDLTRLAVPCLVAWAEDDPLVEASVSRELGLAAPDGPRLAFPDGGHNVQKSRAIELAEALADFARAALAPPDGS